MFLPQYAETRNWSDRVKRMEVPLFPGYVFCRMEGGSRLPVVTTPGVVSIVGRGKIPEPIPSSQIESIRLLMNRHIHLRPCRDFQPGQRVSIQRGPLAGLEGVIQAVKGGYRIIVTVDLLQRSVAAEVDADSIQPVPMAYSA